MTEAELLTRIVERAEISQEEAEKALEVLVEDLAAALRKRGRPLAVEVPPYFDRYITSEINRVTDQISDLRAEINRRFEEVDQRFEEVNWRFDRVDRWFLGLGVPLVLGILAIILKVFFGP